MSPHISIRDSIRWLPDPASEPTRTVVLTSPENRFIDIRILRPTDENDEPQEDHLPLTRLDWAFAGTSTSTPATPDEGKRGLTSHGSWTHWVSSRAASVDGVVDKGDNYAMPDGRTLEKGSMLNPTTGRMTEYEEVWREAAILPTPTCSVRGSEKQRMCIVLTLENAAARARGMVVQLGQLCQGVLRYGDETFSLERWGWSEEGGWQRQVSMGPDWLPCGLVTGGVEKVPALGGKVRFAGLEWVVVEKGIV